MLYRKIWLTATAVLYLTACALPAYRTPMGQTCGAYCLILVPFVMVIPAWWANPIFFVGCWHLARGRYGRALGWGLVALPPGLSYLLMDGYRSFLLMDGYRTPAVGCYVWLTALAALPMAALMLIDRDRAERWAESRRLTRVAGRGQWSGLDDRGAVAGAEGRRPGA